VKYLFSVIIPTRNEEKLLAGCLEQFSGKIKEKFRIEIIVSDGGSTDQTLAIASQHSDTVLQHDDISHRQTIAEGRNNGAAIASGDIFLFINADTRIASIETFLAKCEAQFTADQRLAALAVKVQVMPEERKLSDILFHGFFNSYVRLINFVGISMGRGECQIIRASTFREVKGYNESYAAGEDFELYKRLAKKGKVKYDPSLLVYESPRRYRKYGYAKVYSQWIGNAFSILLRKKAASEVWEEVR
jgi:glycosyltransferase involved in cell wall biosynthesis